MKGNIEQLFRERFQGHEAPVDPGMWQAIQQQLGATAPAAADGVNELFRKRFAEHEAPMDASVWEGISKELGHAAPVAPGQGVLGWAAATAGVLVVAAGMWYLGSNDQAPKASPAPVSQVERAQDPASERSAPEPSSATAAVKAPEAEPLGSDDLPSASVAITQPASVTPDHTPMDDGVAIGGVDPVDPTVSSSSNSVIPVPTTAHTEPALVETIIQQITDRTVNEVRANPEVSPPVTSEPSAETIGVVHITAAEVEVVQQIFMPNTFTPNGDQINDTYEVSRDGFEQLQMRVMSMKNDRLVFSTNTGEPWTGEGCEDGMYVVVVEAVTTDGRPVSKAKVVWLNRERMN